MNAAFGIGAEERIAGLGLSLDISSGLGAPISEAQLRIDLI